MTAVPDVQVSFALYDTPARARQAFRSELADEYANNVNDRYPCRWARWGAGWWTGEIFCKGDTDGVVPQVYWLADTQAFLARMRVPSGLVGGIPADDETHWRLLRRAWQSIMPLDYSR